MAWNVLISSPTMETTAFKSVVPALALLPAAPLLLQWCLALFCTISLDLSNSPAREVGRSPHIWIWKLRPGELNDLNTNGHC